MNVQQSSVRLLIKITLLFVLSSTTVVAQISQTHRYESEVKFNDELFTVISLNDDGLALLQEQNKFDGGKRIWNATLLDTALFERSTIEFKVSERFPLNGYEVKQDHLFLLFRMGETQRNDLLIIDLDTKDARERDRHEIKPEVDLRLTHFNIVDNVAIFAGYVSNDPALLLYDLSSKSLKIVPGFFQKDAELVEVRVNQNNTFNIILVDRSSRSDRNLVFRTFDSTGKLLLEDIVPIEEDITLQTGISSTLQREDLMILGTWSLKNSRQSSGFFALPIDPFRDQRISYYNFGQLEHFLDYLPQKRASRIKESTREDLKEGKRPSFSSYVIPYTVAEGKSGYLLLSEVYNATHTASPYYSTPYANPYYNNPYLMSGPFWPMYYPGMRYRPPNFNPPGRSESVKMFATVATAFDSVGNVLWDASIKLDDIEKNGIEQVGDFYFDGESLTLLYKKESEIKGKEVILGEEENATEISEKIKGKDPADDIRSDRENEGGLEHWNANSFFIWGYQTIRNPHAPGGDKVRNVFYVNKIAVQ